MTAPNIVNTSSIIGITTAVVLSTTNSTLFLSNPSGSNKVFRINNITASNIDGTNNADITIRYHTSAAGGGTGIALANTITIPAGSALVAVGKDNQFYLEEDRSFTAQASVANDLAIFCTYEEIT